jgi:hypothetical protein
LIRLGVAVAGLLPPAVVAPQPLFDSSVRGYVLTGESLTILGYGLPYNRDSMSTGRPSLGDTGSVLGSRGRRVTA